MLTVRQIENPQHCHVCPCGVLVSSDSIIEATLAELGLAFRYQVAVGGIIFDNIDRLCNHPVRLGQVLSRYEIEIVRRGVIFWNLPKLTTLEKTHRQIKSRRTILTLIITVRKEIEDCRRQPRVSKDVGDSLIDLGIATTAFFVGWSSAVAHHGDHEPTLDASAPVLVACEPGDRADRTRRKQEAITIPCFHPAQAIREVSEHC